MLEIFAGQNGRVQFAFEQHGHGIFAGRRPLERVRVTDLGDVRIFEGDPLHAVEVDAVIVLQNAAHPRHRRH